MGKANGRNRGVTMILCIILFVIMIVYRERIPDLKVRRIMFVSNLIAMGLFVFAWVKDGELSEIDRNLHGDGSKKETYLVSVDGVMESQELTLELEEQMYTEEETQDIFSEVMDKLDYIILGQNKSKDKITKDLYLPNFIEEYPVEILWEMDRYDMIELNGTLIQENLLEEGALVELRALLRYQDREAVYVTNVVVYPEEKVGKEKWIYDIQKSFQETEEKSREEKMVTLPKFVAGKEVSWKEPRDRKGYIVLISGMVIAALLLFEKKQDEKEYEQKRQQQMLLDYPEVVSKFAILLGTGMTVKNTWNKIVQTYEEEQASGKNRFAYEEMCLTSREMLGGVTEQEAYERFGKRCKLSSYMKFSMLLSQNLRKGSKGLAEILKMESIQALEVRKNNAKKKGEEAATKLLIPMFLMFAVVLVIVMIPAFLSIQI